MFLKAAKLSKQISHNCVSRWFMLKRWTLHDFLPIKKERLSFLKQRTMIHQACSIFEDGSLLNKECDPK